MPGGRRRAVAALLAFGLGVAVALATSGCRRAPHVCAFCRMTIPAGTAATVVVDGEARQVCDPRCALTHQRQTGTPTALVTATDFETGEPLAPERAFFLTGSDTAPDAGREALPRRMEPVYREWHRCLPSVLAFASHAAATQYRERHGGVVQTLSELGYAAGTAGRPDAAAGRRPRS